MKNILIIGASSAIAQAFARLWAPKGGAFFLVGRDAVKLEDISADLGARGAKSVETFVLDVRDSQNQDPMIAGCIASFRQVDIALIAHGTLPDQQTCETDVNVALCEFDNNGTSVISLLTKIAPHFESQRCGSIVVISSVAGDRGRPSNYLYGAAKAAVTTFSEGLSSRLFKKSVHLMVVKPGFVDTPMTKHLNLPKLLLSTPEAVAKLIDSGIENKKSIIYTPKIWAVIMLIIKSIPDFIFKKLSL